MITEIFSHPDMRAAFVQVRFSVGGITEFFIERSCLLLRVEDHLFPSGVSDRCLGSGEHPGANTLPAVFFRDGNPSDDIHTLWLSGKKAACRGRSFFYI